MAEPIELHPPSIQNNALKKLDFHQETRRALSLNNKEDPRTVLSSLHVVTTWHAWKGQAHKEQETKEVSGMERTGGGKKRIEDALQYQELTH